MNEKFIISIIISLHNIYLLLYSLSNLYYLFFITKTGDSVFMNICNTTCRYIQTLNIHLTACKHSSYLIKNTCNILRVNEQCI